MITLVIKAIAFDFGGVLFTYSRSKLIKDFSGELGISEAMATKAWEAKLEEFENGEISEERFWNGFMETLGARYDTSRLHDIGIRQFTPIRETLEIAAELKKGYTVGILSNQTDWINELDAKYPFMELFNPVVISKEVGFRKPDGAIFETFIRKTGAEPQEIIFIDDSGGYREATESVGMVFVHYKNPAQLRMELRKHGVELTS